MVHRSCSSLCRRVGKEKKNKKNTTNLDEGLRSMTFRFSLGFFLSFPFHAPKHTSAGIYLLLGSILFCKKPRIKIAKETPIPIVDTYMMYITPQKYAIDHRGISTALSPHSSHNLLPAWKRKFHPRAMIIQAQKNDNMNH